MGKVIYDKYNQITLKIDELIKELNWYKEYILTVDDTPFEQLEFVSRNKDIISNAKILEKEIARLKSCSETNDFKYSELEMDTRIIYSAMMLKYFNLI